MKKKIGIFAYHLIPYQIPLYRLLAKNNNVQLDVFFLDNLGSKPFFNKEFNGIIHWDINMLSGYNYSYLFNFTLNKNKIFIKRINFGIFFKFFNQYDAVIITGYDTISSYFALLCAKIFNSKIFFRTEAFKKSNEKKNSLKFKIKKYIVNLFLNNSYKILYSCRSNKEYFEQFIGKSSKLIPFYCSVDNEYYLNIKNKIFQNRDKFRNKLNINNQDICLLYVGRLTERKNCDMIINAVSKINDRRLKILFVGDGPDKKNLEKIAKDLNIAEKIIFIGFKTTSEVCNYLNIADIFILPSKYDPTPKVINEAALFDLPIIISDGVGLKDDFIINNQNGLIYNKNNLNELISCIKILLNKDKRIKFSREIFKQVQKWSPSQNVDSILKNL